MAARRALKMKKKQFFKKIPAPGWGGVSK